MKLTLIIAVALLCFNTAFSNNFPYSNSENTTALKEKKSIILSYSYETEPPSCFGYNDGKASVYASGGSAPYTYIWSNQATSSEIINLNAGRYSVTITDADQEKVIINDIIIEHALPITVDVFAEHMQNNESWICIGETETLISSATGGLAPYSFYWNNHQVSNSISVSPSVSDIYTVYAKDTKGCIGLASEIKVNVYEPLSLSATLTPNSICEGEEVSINIDAHGGDGNYQYQMSSDVYFYNINSSKSIRPQESKNYIVKVSDFCNSIPVEQTLSVTVNPKPQVDFSVITTAGCQPFESSFENHTDLDNNRYLWTFEASNIQSYISDRENPDFTFEKPGQYHVNLQVTSEHGCFAEQTKYNYITVFQKPEAQFEAEQTIRSTINTEIFFNNYSKDSDQSLWIFDDLDSSRVSSPTYSFPQVPGEYLAKLITSNRYGCSDEASHTIKIIDEVAFHMPTAFSPNGDGLNEKFFVSANGISHENFYFAVFDRWGNDVFHTDDVNKSWDGQIQGQLAPFGVYTWIVMFTDTQQSKHEETGQVTLLR